MTKVKTHTWFGTTVNYETVHYFYKLDRWNYNEVPRYRIFILDPDGLVYETVFKCYESEIEENVISCCEGGEN